MMTLRQLREQMTPRRRGKVKPRTPLEQSTVDGAVLTAYREGVIRVEIDSTHTDFSPFTSPEGRREDLNLRVPMEVYLDLDWRIWALIVGSRRLQKNQERLRREWEIPLHENALTGNKHSQRTLEEDHLERESERVLFEEIFSYVNPRWRAVITARFRDGCSRSALARQTGQSLETLRALEYRIRKKITRTCSSAGRRITASAATDTSSS